MGEYIHWATVRSPSQRLIQITIFDNSQIHEFQKCFQITNSGNPILKTLLNYLQFINKEHVPIILTCI